MRVGTFRQVVVVMSRATGTAQGPPDSWAGRPYRCWPLISMLALGPLPTSAAFARSHTRDVLAEWRLPVDLIRDAEMLVSELSTNALRATWSLQEAMPIALWLLANQQRLTIEVWDCHAGDPARRPAPADAEDGRGLVIIEAYSNRWGVRRATSRVKAVWCELLIQAD
jgi:anti-sigma regulatory factor (Ser/Thr protein kinase)